MKTLRRIRQQPARGTGRSSSSAEDREATQRVGKAGEILGIRLLDHIVFTTEGAYSSFAESSPELLR